MNFDNPPDAGFPPVQPVPVTPTVHNRILACRDQILSRFSPAARANIAPVDVSCFVAEELRDSGISFAEVRTVIEVA